MSIVKKIDAIKGLSAAAAADEQRTREGFAAFAQLANERMNNRHAALTEEHVILTKAVRGIKIITAINDLARFTNKKSCAATHNRTGG
jgi:hypothetical protein